MHHSPANNMSPGVVTGPVAFQLFGLLLLLSHVPVLYQILTATLPPRPFPHPHSIRHTQQPSLAPTRSQKAPPPYHPPPPPPPKKRLENLPLPSPHPRHHRPSIRIAQKPLPPTSVPSDNSQKPRRALTRSQKAPPYHPPPPPPPKKRLENLPLPSSHPRHDPPSIPIAQKPLPPLTPHSTSFPSEDRQKPRQPPTRSQKAPPYHPPPPPPPKTRLANLPLPSSHPRHHTPSTRIAQKPHHPLTPHSTSFPSDDRFQKPRQVPTRSQKAPPYHPPPPPPPKKRLANANLPLPSPHPHHDPPSILHVPKQPPLTSQAGSFPSDYHQKTRQAATRIKRAPPSDLPCQTMTRIVKGLNPSFYDLDFLSVSELAIDNVMYFLLLFWGFM